jgi:SAM-dependent methyltransferase
MASEEAAGIIGLYQRKARDWIESRARSGLFEKPWLDRFRAQLPPAGPILDLGCGSAEPMAAHLIALGYPVVGVDSSPAMIDVCRGRFPKQEWIVADMRKLALAAVFRHPCVGQFLSPLPRRPAPDVSDISGARSAEGGPDVHKRSRAWGGDREFWGRAAVSCELRPGRISFIARPERVSRGVACP